MSMTPENLAAWRREVIKSREQMDRFYGAAAALVRRKTMTNVNDKMMIRQLQVRPMHNLVLKLVITSFDDCDEDTGQSYMDLLTATVLVARSLGFTDDDVAGVVRRVAHVCDIAVAKRPDIFGPAWQQNPTPASSDSEGGA